MKKILFVFMMACAALFVLASCGSTPAPQPAPAPEQSVPPPPPPDTPPPSPAPEPTPPAPPPPPPPVQDVRQVPEQAGGDIILEGAKIYTVVRYDTLSKIAINNYGRVNGYYFPLIMLASGDVVDDPDLIEPGTRLTIPDLQRNLSDPGARAKIKEFLNEIANVYDRKRIDRMRDDLRALANSL